MYSDRNDKTKNAEETLLQQNHTDDKIQREIEEIGIPTKGFYKKLKYLSSNITVEPIMAGLVIPAALAKLAVQNLNLEKACLAKLKYGPEICEPLIKRHGHNLTDYEREVQKVISSIEVWRSIIHTALPTLVVMFMGAWSDRTGNRKMCMLLPIFGGWVTIYLGVFSYVSDITTVESRTFRIGLVNLCLTVGIPIGTGFSGILLESWGYVGTFLLSGSIYLLTMVYGCLYLKSVTKTVNNKNEQFKFSDLLTLQKDTVSVVTKKRHGDLRLMIILNLLVVAIIYGPIHAEYQITYLFVRYRLRWDAVKYSIYSTYNHLTHSLAAFLSISILSKRWGFDDAVLCLISAASRLAGSVYIHFVHTDLQMYLVPIVQFLNATTFTSLRAMTSKLVPSEEMGKMNSLFSLVETLGALVFDPVYATIYSRTMKQFTSAIYLFSAAMTLPAITMLLGFIFRNRRQLRKKALELEEQGDLPKNCHTPTPS